MFKFNESSMVCGFIQNLLRNKYIPTIPVIKDIISSAGDPIKKNKEGKEEAGPSQSADYYIENKLPVNTNYIKNNEIYTKIDSNNIEYIGNLEFGKKYPNITSNYIPTCNYYSTELHEWLGRYLRAFSDYYKIDLMAFYNCFSNRLLQNIGLPIKVADKTTGADESTEDKENEDNTVSVNWYEMSPIDPKSTVTCFPIRPDTDYIIKIYGGVSGNIIVQPVYFNGTSLLDIKANTESASHVMESKTLPYVGPIEYRYTPTIIENESKNIIADEYANYYRNPKYLYLFLQIPQSSSNLRISVIEKSEYFNTINKTLLNLENIDYNVPFSDRLLEYLTENVITRVDKIKQNISRVQEIIKSGSFNSRYNKKPIKDMKAGKGDKPVPPYNNIETTDTDGSYTGVRGIYDDSMRAYIYNSLINEQIVPDSPLTDFNGYVDKDVEQLLMRIVSQDKSLQEKLLEI